MRAALLALALAGCATAPASIAPLAPKVDCRQPEPARTAVAPQEGGWIEESAGVARLSQAAVLWIRGVLGAREADRGLWRVQEACLDDYRKAGHIR